LPEERKGHADGTNLGRENLRDVEVHGRVAESTLEGEVEEDEEHADGITGLVVSASVKRDHCNHDRRRNDDAGEASHVHLAAGVDAIVQPGTTGVVDQASGGEPKSREEEGHVASLSKVRVEDNGVVILKSISMCPSPDFVSNLQ
jgi:hypothetical protein